MHGLAAAFAAELSARYRVLREAGRGGNAIVYAAQDLRHDRLVALKMLLPELTASVRTERFLREIQIAAKLTHPHILPLHDSGEAAGTLYYVMPYVEGESLRARLLRERQLPLEDALRITREVANALAYAHSHGVVHRDIKPENILFADGMAVVADFGIARALSEASSGSMTLAGIAVGTPEYMSPEQCAGNRELDGRSDLYALGCVLYEMLAGHPPFTGASAQEILSRHALDPVPRLAAARPDVPDSVEGALRKALSKSPPDRFSSTAEFAAALSTQPALAGTRPTTPASVLSSLRAHIGQRRRLVQIAVVAGLIAAGSVIALRGERKAAAASARSIGVLPFVNMSADREANEYFSDGLTDELINALSQIDSLQVAARTSSFAFKNKNLSIRTIGDSLRVAAVLEGSVKREGTRLRVTAQLVNVADGYHLWSRNFDREVHDAIALQGEIARAIADAFRIELSAREQKRLDTRETANPEAYDLYLRGRYFVYRRNRDALFRGIDYFTRAIQLDPTYALAHSGLADGYTLAVNQGYVPRSEQAETLRKAEDAALRALSLDSAVAETHASHGRVLIEHGRRSQTLKSEAWSAAEHRLNKAIALGPRYAQAHSWLCVLYRITGRYPEAYRASQNAERLEPLLPQVAFCYGSAAVQAHDYDLAIEKLRKAVELEPSWIAPYEVLGDAFLARRMHDSAAVQFQHAVRMAGSPGAKNRNLMRLATVYAYWGKREQALDILRVIETATPEQVNHRSLSLLFISLGQRARAISALERAVQEGNVLGGQGFDFKSNSEWHGLRDDPRFKKILQRVGLE